jgi:hypothetical protein
MGLLVTAVMFVMVSVAFADDVVWEPAPLDFPMPLYFAWEESQGAGRTGNALSNPPVAHDPNTTREENGKEGKQNKEDTNTPPHNKALSPQ